MTPAPPPDGSIWLGLRPGDPSSKALRLALRAAVERDASPDALPDSGEVWPLGDLPPRLLLVRAERSLDLGGAPGRAEALAALDALELQGEVIPWTLAGLWKVFQSLVEGAPLGALASRAGIGAEGPFSRPWVRRWLGAPGDAA